MRHTLALGVAAVLPLACAPQIPQINYDDPAALHTEPPKPVKIVQMPELLPLPGQLKRMPRGAGSTSASEPGDPVRRVQLANAAASVKPTRAGYVNAIQVYPYNDGALYRLYVAPVHVTDIALEPGEQLKAVAAGDTTQWKIGDHRERSGATRQAHVLVKPVSADLPMNNIVIATDRRTYHIEAHPTRETYGGSLLALSTRRVRRAATTECRSRGTRQRHGGWRHRRVVAALPIPDQRGSPPLAAGGGL
jgi:type IV secretion system protein VirB9